MKYDEAFESVFRRVLHFPFDSQDPLVSPNYDNAFVFLSRKVDLAWLRLRQQLLEVCILLLLGLLGGMHSEILVLGSAVGRHWERVVFPTFCSA